MKHSRSSCSNNRLRIYQWPLVERISVIAGTMFFTVLLIFGFMIAEIRNKDQAFALLGAIGWVLICHILCICAFQSYICLDMNANKLIVQEFPGWKRVEIDLNHIKEMTVTDDFPYSNEFIYTLNIIFPNGQVKKFHNWSTHSLRGNKRRQKVRLNTFVKEANQRLMNRDS